MAMGRDFCFACKEARSGGVHERLFLGSRGSPVAFGASTLWMQMSPKVLAGFSVACTPQYQTYARAARCAALCCTRHHHHCRHVPVHLSAWYPSSVLVSTAACGAAVRQKVCYLCYKLLST